LDVALHSLRKALRSAIFMPVILFEGGGYIFEPSLQIWLDVEEFERCIQAGQRFESRNQRTAAVKEYEAAISLYQEDFLEQNPYEEWTVLDRERLRIVYLDTLDRLSHIYFEQERYAACIAVCQQILARDRCLEDAHCILMRCYSNQGQTHLALRQYHICVDALRTELGVDPDEETTKVYQEITNHRHV
jgi:DNA-binding SARP family transcriptional activator